MTSHLTITLGSFFGRWEQNSDRKLQVSNIYTTVVYRIHIKYIPANIIYTWLCYAYMPMYTNTIYTNTY